MQIPNNPGRDVAIIGFRDEPSIRFLVPSLTCFGLSLEELGKELGAALLAQIPHYKERYPSGIVQRALRLEIKPGESDRHAPCEGEATIPGLTANS